MLNRSSNDSLTQDMLIRRKVSAVSSLVSLYVVCFVLLFTSINALIGVRIIVLKKYDDINSLDDIANKSDIMPAIYNSSSLETFFVSEHN